MVAARTFMSEEWRRPGCGAACHAVTALIIGDPFKSRLVLHDPVSHETWGSDMKANDLGIREWGVVTTGGITIDRLRQRVSLNGENAGLTPLETRLMLYLANQVGLICSYYDILRVVWGPEYVAAAPAASLSGLRDGQMDRDVAVIRTHLSRIRLKLGPYRKLLVSVARVGLLLRDDAPAEATS